MLNISPALEEADHTHLYKEWRSECREPGNGKITGLAIIACHLHASCHNILFLYVEHNKGLVLYK